MLPPSGTFLDATKRLNAFASRAGESYTRNRNYDLGPSEHNHVSGLSPYLARRVLLPEEVINKVLSHHSKASCSKFCQEVYWQTYWKAWLEMRPQVWDDYKKHDPFQGDLLTQAMNAQTGIDAFDFWVEELKSTGYLHNHARMWFASIWIHTLELPWKLGAKFFFDHLCDADSASNTLSWRWVAGLHTKGKAYLASKENIKKFTQGRFKAEGLASQPKPITDTVSDLELKPLDQLGTTPEESDLWMIFPGDYSVHRFYNLENKNILILDPDLAYPWASDLVKKFNEYLRNDLANEIPQSQIIREISEIPSYLIEKKINSMTFIKPHVGIYFDLYTQISDLIPPHIKMKPIIRSWDHTYFPTATAGFFSFKKKNHIL